MLADARLQQIKSRPLAVCDVLVTGVASWEAIAAGERSPAHLEMPNALPARIVASGHRLFHSWTHNRLRTGRPDVARADVRTRQKLNLGVQKGDRGLAPSVDQLTVLAFLWHSDQQDLPALPGIEHDLLPNDSPVGLSERFTTAKVNPRLRCCVRSHVMLTSLTLSGSPILLREGRAGGRRFGKSCNFNASMVNPQLLWRKSCLLECDVGVGRFDVDGFR
jgi:hypothetical protein